MTVSLHVVEKLLKISRTSKVTIEIKCNQKFKSVKHIFPVVLLLLGYSILSYYFTYLGICGLFYCTI